VRSRDAWLRRSFAQSATPLALLGEDRTLATVNEAFAALVGVNARALVGRRLDEFEAEGEAEGDDERPADGLPVEPVVAPAYDGSARFERRYRHADGSIGLHEVTLTPLIGREGDRMLLCQHRDITRQRRAEVAERSARALAEQRAAQQQAVAELGRAALMAGSLDEVLDRGCHVMRELLACPSVVALQRTSKLDGTRLLLRAGVGLPDHPRVGEPWVVHQEGIAYAAQETGEPVVLPDSIDPEDRYAVAAIMRQEGLRSAIVVPVPASPGEPTWGLLSAASPMPHAFAETERTFVDAVAHVVAAAALRLAAEEQTQHLAWHDPLTGLPNRLLLGDRLDSALHRARRTGRQVAVLVADLDSFKAVNDRRGHAAGDVVLRDVASRLREVLRPQDTVARFGGDEFVIVLEDVDGPDGARRVAERARSACSRPVPFGERDIEVHTSVGVSLSPAGSQPAAAVRTAAALLRDADAAMYRAKRLGGDRVELF
jgi:diguanylate cyclase (GGDEF)-like protein/PAS domain S-box-containing protein